MTVLVADDYGVTALSAVDGVHPVRFTAGEPLPPEAADAEVLVPGYLAGDHIAQLLAELPKLRYIQLLSAGAEHWVHRMPAGVTLATCRGAHGGSTAELVVGGLLALYRDFDRFAAARADRRWDLHATETLQDKRILIVGAGDLGAEVRRRLIPFDVDVTLVGRTARDGVRGIDELSELLGEYDAVVLVVPLTSRTRGMVDAAFLARMRDGAILVNAARGAVVVTDALVEELRTGRLRAVLDVTDPEPLPPDHPLWTMAGLFLTPHVGGLCTGVRERSWRIAAAEIARYVAGEQPHNLVNINAEY